MDRVILAVCPNPALDVTYTTDRFTPGSSVRVREVHTRAGGKGANVARVATALGADATVLGFLGGANGRAIERELTAAGIAVAALPVAGETRRTLAVVGPDDTTVFNEPGPTTDADDWDRLVELTRTHARDSAVVTLSGSLPPGSPNDAYARLVDACSAPTVLDTSGAHLLSALGARPAVVKPNHDEATQILGRPVTTPDEALAACAEFVARGAGACVITMGAAGLVAQQGDRRFRVAIGRTVRGNPTGAGDAFTAALAVGLAGGTDWTRLLPDCAAVAGAAVARPVAGEIDPATRANLLPHIALEELP